jgi:hypothetical protein
MKNTVFYPHDFQKILKKEETRSTVSSKALPG